MMLRSLTHWLPSLALALLAATTTVADGPVDLLAGGDTEWLPADSMRWAFSERRIAGRSLVFDGAKTDPEASAFLESRRVFGGDKQVDVEIEFDHGRYFGIYVDYDPATESGIWMATGHHLPDAEKVHNVESAYIKTVDHGHWIVRATGELAVAEGERLRLRFERRGDDYRIWQGDRLVVTYRKAGGYPPGKLRLRLVNGAASIHRLDVRADRITPGVDVGP